MTAQGEDILAWLESAISTAERTAREAAEAAEGESWEEYNQGVYVSGPGGDVLADGVLYGDLYEQMKLPVVRHMSLNDPESVLRRCAADRKLISQHGPCSDTDRGCKGCGFDNQEESMVDDYSSCPVLLALAEGYGWTEGKR